MPGSRHDVTSHDCDNLCLTTPAVQRLHASHSLPGTCEAKIALVQQSCVIILIFRHLHGLHLRLCNHLKEALWDACNICCVTRPRLCRRAIGAGSTAIKEVAGQGTGHLSTGCLCSRKCLDPQFTRSVMHKPIRVLQVQCIRSNLFFPQTLFILHRVSYDCRLLSGKSQFLPSGKQLIP